MLGALGWSGARLNFTNFIALPITFGIAAEYSINVIKRWQSNGPKSSTARSAPTVSAVALCSLTTVVGYGSLFMAQNRALFSFGEFAVTGELTCLLTAIVVLPAALVLHELHRRRHSGRTFRGVLADRALELSGRFTTIASGTRHAALAR